MSLSNPPIIVRRLIIAASLVFVIGGSLGSGYWLYMTSEAYQRRADEHAKAAAVHESNRTSMDPPWSEDEGRKAEYHAQMNRKWEYAAYHPWLSVAPDPPIPKVADRPR